ncbi:UvrD-helicase domain-containing protein [Phytoactinopolyspora halotolerans]|uniref:DNA 3'-5' helicase n=1 Tax=Phytoactinopolyspora halotolerans TaxID=1981512 RepID=A0A6L9S7Y0_9ACTN|nr:UvrD-helicase domain-containing protein [Phytoactinopolyspora halotolerans]NEE01147.1 UvrD-helicase domain-containing protein [Phytoactinopolyspora halotolerans]
MYDIRLTKPYTDSIRKFEHRPDVLASLLVTTTELTSQPFQNPRLQTHAVKNCPAGTYTSYVGNRGHRLIWRLIKRVIILLVVDEHDAAYRRAERLKLEIDDQQNVLRVYDIDPATEGQQPYEERRQVEGSLFMAWNDRDLLGLGFRQHEVPVLRRLDNEDSLLDLEPRMRPEAFTLAYNVLAHGNPQGEQAAIEARQAKEREEATRVDDGFFLADEAEERTLVSALDQPGSRDEFVPVTADELARILAAPIEDWMVYLDPSQQGLVDRRFNGPARIRGAAGTGKTVVALHRAREMAREAGDSKVLFTTFIRSIPAVLEHIFSRFAPDERQRVEFKNIHAWALGLLGRAGRGMNIDLSKVDRAWKRACDRVLTDTSPLQRASLTRSYLREEIDWLVKGRALGSLDDYLGLQRSGRGTPLSKELRTDVWSLYESYETELQNAGVHDFNDVLTTAYKLVRDSEITLPYTAIIADEAQDLTEVSIRLLHAAVGDRENGLLLVGDGQQSIYPGGYNLASLGVDVRGRATRLTKNYRNTRQIVDAAFRVVEHEEFDDGGEILEPGKREIQVMRDGSEPVRCGFETSDDHDLALAADIEAAIDAGCGQGDVAVLVPTNRLVAEYVSRISQIGLTTQKLEHYDGHPNSHVKVGTYQRAKGLEFKRVYLPRLDLDGLSEAQRRNEDDKTYAERIALLRRRLFVAMTRARDALWLGWVGAPSSLIAHPETPQIDAQSASTR